MPETNGSKRYIAEVEEVHSGDDLILMVDLGVDNLYKKVRARLHGVDTPDAYRAEAGTAAGKIRDEVKRLVEGKECFIEALSYRKGSWIVNLYLPVHGKAPLCLNQHLKDQGYVFEKAQEK